MSSQAGQQPSENPIMDSQLRICAECHQPLAIGDSDRICPQCGQQLGGNDLSAMDLANAETVFFEHTAASQESTDLAQQYIGRTFDAYAVEAMLGRGGMAWVFRAQHEWLQRPCAIKILCPQLQQRSDEFLDKFIAEARAAASVVHPHIVTVHNIGQTGEHHYIELEYVPGRSLQSILRQRKRLPPLLAVELLLQSCSALAAAHRNGLIHRAFKPSNILITEDYQAKLSDFGLAKRIVAGGAQQVPETLAGTPPYMAPELFAGRRADARSDVYAVGVSWYYLLTGELPFAERNLRKLIDLHTHAAPPDPREQCAGLPDEVVQLIERCLAKRPEQRPKDADHLHAELREVYLGLRDIRSLVVEAMAAVDLKVESQGDRHVVNVPLEGGRQQRIYIEDQTEGPWDEHLVRIYSLCCPVQDSYFRKALELNADIAHGALAIDEVDGQPYFVMVNHYSRRTCGAEEIRRSVVNMSKWADQVEFALTGEDRH